jgi:hypothetical protein
MSTDDTHFDPEQENPEVEDQQGQEANPEDQGPDLQPGEAPQPPPIDLTRLREELVARASQDPEFARLLRGFHEGLGEHLDALGSEDRVRENVRALPPFNPGARAGLEWAYSRATPSELDRLVAFARGSDIFVRGPCHAVQFVFMINPEAAPDRESALRYWHAMLEDLESLSGVEYDPDDQEFQTGFFAWASMYARAPLTDFEANSELGRECGENWASTRACLEELRQLLRFDEYIGLEQVLNADYLDDEEIVRMLVLLVTPPSPDGVLAWRETWQRMVGRTLPRPNPWTRSFAASFFERAIEVARYRPPTEPDPGEPDPENPDPAPPQSAEALASRWRRNLRRIRIRERPRNSGGAHDADEPTS